MAKARSSAHAPEIPWLSEVTDEMRGFENLAQDWDSYGGGPVRTDTVDAAVEIASLMGSHGFSRPHVCPQSSGGVILEWEHGDRALIVDVGDNQGFSFAYQSAGAPELEGDFELLGRLLNAGVEPI